MLNRFERRGLLAEPSQGSFCLVPDCGERRWGPTSRCLGHLPSQRNCGRKVREAAGIGKCSMVGRKPLEARVLGQIPVCSTGQDGWTVTTRFRSVLQVLKNLKDLEWVDNTRYRPKIYLIDTEFYMRTGEVFQASILDFVENEMLVDACLINQKSDVKDIQLEPSEEAFRNNILLKQIAGQSGRKSCTRQELAEMVNSSGITKRDFFLEWSNRRHNSLDLSFVREIMNDAGYEDILPLESHSVSLIREFRLNLPSSLSLRLDCIFPAIFSQYRLVGLNHTSDNDVRITRLMVLYLLKHTGDPYAPLKAWAQLECEDDMKVQRIGAIPEPGGRKGFSSGGSPDKPSGNKHRRSNKSSKNDRLQVKTIFQKKSQTEELAADYQTKDVIEAAELSRKAEGPGTSKEEALLARRQNLRLVDIHRREDVKIDVPVSQELARRRDKPKRESA